MKEINLGSHSELEKYKNLYTEILKNKTVHKQSFNIKTYNSIGTNMTNCNNCVNVFSWEDSENCTNCLRGTRSKDCIDLTGSWYMEVSGNDSCCTNSYDLKYSIWCDGAKYSEYCDQCVEIENCFGCVSLRKKKYCILNKQYSKEEYEVLKEKIISDMKEALSTQKDGVAIAAPQIGISLRIFVVSDSILKEADKDYKSIGKDIVFINPEIVKLSRQKVDIEEGCLSVRWKYGKVKRSVKTTIKGYNENGEIVEN